MTDAPGATSSHARSAVPAGKGLAGDRVALTGRLATISRRQAAEAISAAGGRLVAGVTAQTTMLVVGMRGWPLLENGRVTQKLGAAEELRAGGAPIRIVGEADFRRLVGLDPAVSAGPKPLEAGQVAAALGVEPAVLERWRQLGLVSSADGCYDFRDLVSLRTVTDLVSRGVSPVVIRRSLEGLAGVLPGVDRPLAQLKILVEASGRLVAELEHALVAPGGQLEFRFEGAGAPTDGETAPIAACPPRAEMEAREGVTRLALGPVGDEAAALAHWLQEGVEFEATGDLERAEGAFRRAIETDPTDATAQFNLGNVLLARGRAEAAAERFAQAAVLAPGHSRAWFNLAHTQDELAQPERAAESLRRAIAADPEFADARFNLADVLDRLGRRDEARTAWREYLRLECAGEWAEEARRRMSG